MEGTRETAASTAQATSSTLFGGTILPRSLKFATGPPEDIFAGCVAAAPSC